MTYTPYTPLYAPYQNYVPQQNVQQNQQQGMIWVRNSQEAAMYPVAPNAAVTLWDSGSPVVYLKQADASGKPSMKTYDLVERVEKPAEKAEEFATKAELSALAVAVKDVDGIISGIRKDIELLKKKEEDDG